MFDKSNIFLEMRDIIKKKNLLCELDSYPHGKIMERNLKKIMKIILISFILDIKI